MRYDQGRLLRNWLLLSGHFMPKPLIIAECFKFWTRMKDQNENVTNYAAELRHLSNTCEFPQVFLDEALRDKFVHGRSHMPTQKSLLTKDNSLTFQKALETPTAIEMAEGDAQRMKSQGDNGRANDVNNLLEKWLHYRETKKLQPLNISVNMLRQAWEEWISEGLHSYTATRKMH